MENLFRAYKEARRSKRRIRKYPELVKFEKDLNLSLCKLQLELINGTWKPSGKYRRFVTWDTGKERIVDWNPSFVDNVVQHAIQQTAGQVLLRAGIRDTYSGIPGRGVHDGVKRIARFLKEYRMDLMPCYVMKLDVRKFYASIDLDRLKEKIRRRIKDQRMLHVIDQVIDSHPNGLPIGNYLSQHLANFFNATESIFWATCSTGTVFGCGSATSGISGRPGASFLKTHAKRRCTRWRLIMAN